MEELSPPKRAQGFIQEGCAYPPRVGPILSVLSLLYRGEGNEQDALGMLSLPQEVQLKDRTC